MATTKNRRATPKLSAKAQAPVPAIDDISFEAGSGNVFADMGVADAEERLVKAELARIVRKLVHDRIAKGRTQGFVARAIGIAAPDLSDLMRGKLTRFSRERLEMLLVKLGMTVHVVVAPAAADDRPALTIELVGGPA
jgi:predicted XRE-type DNA-binding protein